MGGHIIGCSARAAGVDRVRHLPDIRPLEARCDRSCLLNPAGSFALHYPLLSATLAYVGTYQQDGDRIRFRFSGDGRWDAEGALNGDSLTVRYNIIMEMSDFENATYKRAP